MDRILIFLRKHARLLAIVAVVVGVTAANAQVPAGPHRPAGVPEGYLVTPFGYFHPSCVHQLDKDATLLKDERTVRHADGSFENISACDHPRYRSDGKLITKGSAIAPNDAEINTKDVGEAKGPAITHAWIETASVTTGFFYGELAASWVVPNAPATNDGQIIYLFPGLEDANDPNPGTILQPVLGWNAPYTNNWGILSWNCCVANTVWYSTPVGVASGDVITGTIKSNCSAGTQSACTSWNVTTEDITKGHSTTLVDTSSFGQIFNWAFSGALEVYDIAQCSDYPLGGALTFTNVKLYDWSFNRISSPAWKPYEYPGIALQCNYNAQVSPNSVTLSYGATPTAAQHPTQCGLISPGQGLRIGQSWPSCDGRFSLNMQADGNLVLYEGTTPLWATNTQGALISEVIMQSDGNLVLYNDSNAPLWASNTSGHANAYLQIQTDGNAVVYAGTTPLWDTATWGH
jgi:hypothetical protein